MLKALQRKLKKAPNLEGVLILWWGSFFANEHLTIGDAHAVSNVRSKLVERGINPLVVLADDGDAMQDTIKLSDAHRLAGSLKAIVFVCGPLNPHPELLRILNDNPHAKKIAAGVSVLGNHHQLNRQFDRIVARDGLDDALFDLAPARFADIQDDFVEPDNAIGLCFVGFQGDYGANRHSLHEKAEHMLRRTAAYGRCRINSIDTVFSTPENDASAIEAGFRSSKVILTTRLHGSLYSLLHSRPVIAVDQIPGGAKVSAVLGAVGWPFVFSASTVTLGQLENALKLALSGALDDIVAETRSSLIAKSEVALERSVEVIAAMAND